MLQSLVVYTCVALIMIFFGIVASRRERVYNERLLYLNKPKYELTFFYAETIIPLIIFAIVFGCRYNVGVDYPAYLDAYLYGDYEEWEFLFRWITGSLSKMGIHYASYFTLWAFIQIFLLFYTFRNYRYLFPYMAFFLIFGNYYLSMMNIIRQQIAACIFVYSIQYIDTKQFFKYLLCVFIASLFHKSAWLVSVFYPLFQWKKDWFSSAKIQFILYAIALYLSTKYNLVVSLISRPFALFTDLAGYENYLEGILYNETLNSMNQFGNNTGLGKFIAVFFTLTIIIYSNRIRAYYNNSLFDIIYSLWFIRILADFIVGDSIILNRPFVYVYNFKIVMLSYFMYYCFQTKKKGTQILGCIFLLVHVTLFLNVISNGEVNTSMFTFFWQKK